MKKNIILPIILGAVSLALAVVSFVLLPDTVVTQISAGGSGATTMPKLLAVALPTALGVGGAAVEAFSKEKKDGVSKALIVSAVGVLVFVIMLVVNL